MPDSKTATKYNEAVQKMEDEDSKVVKKDEKKEPIDELDLMIANMAQRQETIMLEKNSQASYLVQAPKPVQKDNLDQMIS